MFSQINRGNGDGILVSTTPVPLGVLRVKHRALRIGTSDLATIWMRICTASSSAIGSPHGTPVGMRRKEPRRKEAHPFSTTVPSGPCWCLFESRQCSGTLHRLPYALSAGRRSLSPQGRVKKKSERKARQPDIPPVPKFDQEPLTSSEEDIPMYFTRREQLLDIFQVALRPAGYLGGRRDERYLFWGRATAYRILVRL